GVDRTEEKEGATSHDNEEKQTAHSGKADSEGSDLTNEDISPNATSLLALDSTASSTLIKKHQKKPQSTPPPTIHPDVTVTISPRLFAEISKIVVPLVERAALAAPIPSQSLTRTLPLLGSVELFSASVQITEAKIKSFALLLGEGHLAFDVDEVEFTVVVRLRAWNGTISNVVTTVAAKATVKGTVSVLIDGRGALDTTIEDVYGRIFQFQFQIRGIPSMLEGFVDTLNNFLDVQIRGAIEKVLPFVMGKAVTFVLNDALGKLCSVKGDVQGIGFQVKTAFVGEPKISPEGLVASLAFSAAVS
ncbi:hypothetical protein HK102_012267, partial [Quaeritorhiza haematococci]